jgi:hypothetical protein
MADLGAAFAGGYGSAFLPRAGGGECAREKAPFARAHAAVRIVATRKRRKCAGVRFSAGA